MSNNIVSPLTFKVIIINRIFLQSSYFGNLFPRTRSFAIVFVIAKFKTCKTVKNVKVCFSLLDDIRL